MVSELTVIIKDEEKTLKKTHLIHDAYHVDDNDPIIKTAIEDLLKEFNAEPSDINVKIKMCVR